MGHHTDSAKYRRSLKRRHEENVGGEAGVERGTSIDDSNISCRPCLLRSLDARGGELTLIRVPFATLTALPRYDLPPSGLD